MWKILGGCETGMNPKKAIEKAWNSPSPGQELQELMEERKGKEINHYEDMEVS